LIYRGKNQAGGMVDILARIRKKEWLIYRQGSGRRNGH
jgi:hypothetical protein